MIFPHNHGGQRPTAYTHMKPFERVSSFIGAQLYYCEKNIEAMKTELAMWDEPEVIALLGAEDVSKLRDEAFTVMESLKSEQQVWTARKEKLGMCNTCGGSGWYWVCVAQDESVRHKCEGCKGTGKFDTTQPVAAIVTPTKPKREKPGLLELIGRKFR